jgi:hypothetical protein
MNASRLGLLVALVCSTWGPAGASNMRCGSQIISPGETEQGVLARCGPPSAMRPLLASNGPWQSLEGQDPPYEPNMVWRYDPGYGRFLNILTFESGVLTEVRQGPREQ